MEEFKFITDYFNTKDVINPNGDIRWTGSMAPYIQAVEQSDITVISEYMGYIGRGVFDEAAAALDAGVPIKCIRENGDGDLVMVDVNALREEDTEDWAIKYGRVIAKGEGEKERD